MEAMVQNWYYLDENGDVQGPWDSATMQSWRPWFVDRGTPCFCGNTPPADASTFLPYNDIEIFQAPIRTSQLPRSPVVSLAPLPAADFFAAKLARAVESSTVPVVSPMDSATETTECWYIDNEGEVQGPHSERQMKQWSQWFTGSTSCFCRPSQTTQSQTTQTPADTEKPDIRQFKPMSSLFEWAAIPAEPEITNENFEDKLVVKMQSCASSYRGNVHPDSARNGNTAAAEESTVKVDLNTRRPEVSVALARQRRRKFRAHLKLVQILTRAKKHNARGARLEKNVRTMETDMNALRLARTRNAELDKKMTHLGLPAHSATRHIKESRKTVKKDRPMTIIELPENFAAQQLSNLDSERQKGINRKKSPAVQAAFTTKSSSIFQTEVQRLLREER